MSHVVYYAFGKAHCFWALKAINSFDIFQVCSQKSCVSSEELNVSDGYRISCKNLPMREQCKSVIHKMNRLNMEFDQGLNSYRITLVNIDLILIVFSVIIFVLIVTFVICVPKKGLGLLKKKTTVLTKTPQSSIINIE